MGFDVLVVGGGTAGSVAAYHLGRRGLKTLLVAGERHIGYSKCGLPYLIGGLVKRPEDLYEVPPDSLRTVGVEAVYPRWVENIDLSSKTAFLSDGDEVGFRKLVLATGAEPVIPPIPGRNLPGVVYLRTMEDALLIMRYIRDSSSVAIIGANLTGLELSEAFLSLGLEVTLIDIMDRPLWRILDADMSKPLLKRMGGEDKLRLYLSKRVERIVGRDRVTGVRVSGAGEVEADLVVLGTGARPNSKLALKAGLRTGETGGILVDDYLRAGKDVYALGDCIEVRNIVSGRPTVAQLSSAAERQAWVVAKNVADGDVVRYGGELPVAITRFFDIYVGVAGYTHEQAEREGMNPRSKLITARTHSPFIPGAKRVRLKLTFEGDRLIGGQVVGFDAQAVANRVNMIALAIQLGAGVDDLRMFRYGYAPPLSDVVDPFVRVGWMLATDP